MLLQLGGLRVHLVMRGTEAGDLYRETDQLSGEPLVGGGLLLDGFGHLGAGVWELPSAASGRL